MFDKDDFNDFNEAIQLTKKYGFECAWSNEAFELWYFLHFQYLDSAISRHDYIIKLLNEIRKHKGYERYEYKKNDSSTYQLITSIGDEEFAKNCAIQLREYFKSDNDYQEHKPCTTVDLLVAELEFPEKLLKE